MLHLLQILVLTNKFCYPRTYVLASNNPTYLHKVHTLQVYDLVGKAPTKNLAYKVYKWEGHFST